MDLITRAQFAELALALPEATQASHFGKPDFRVRNKIFAGLDSSVERGSLKVRSEIQQVLVAARPEAFAPAAGAWGNSGWRYVTLEHVELDELRELLADAWRLITSCPKFVPDSPCPRCAGEGHVEPVPMGQFAFGLSSTLGETLRGLRVSPIAPASLAAQHAAVAPAPLELVVTHVNPPRPARRKRSPPRSKAARKPKKTARSSPSS